MPTSEVAKAALSALIHNKLRTFLTILGVIIGVFAIVSLVSLVTGVQNYINDQFSELGADSLFIYPGAAGFTNDPSLSFTNNKLSEQELVALESLKGTYISYSTPIIALGQVAEYKNSSFYSVVMGANSDIGKIINYQTSAGRLFTKGEENASTRVPIIGNTVKESLFGSIDPIGKEIKLGSRRFEVIGILPKKSADFDEQILAPYTTLEKEYSVKKYTYIMLKLAPGVDQSTATAMIKQTLLKYLKPDDFTIYTQKDLLSTVSSVISLISSALIAVAAISLIVGGIGIMNIMLVSITERTNEIGLRKAVGATSRDISKQFLLETVVISMIGGIFGLLLGNITTAVAQKWLRAEIPIWSIVLALGFSSLVGLAFGTYPAIKASKQDAIDSLRFE